MNPVCSRMGVCQIVVSFSDYLHDHPLCRRSKRLKSNSRVVLFSCDNFLDKLIAVND